MVNFKANFKLHSSCPEMLQAKTAKKKYGAAQYVPIINLRVCFNVIYKTTTMTCQSSFEDAASSWISGNKIPIGLDSVVVYKAHHTLNHVFQGRRCNLLVGFSREFISINHRTGANTDP